MPGIKYFQLARKHFAPFVFFSRKNFLPIEIAQVPGERITDSTLWIEAEHLGSGSIEVADFTIAPGHDDAFLDGVKECFEKTFFPRKFQHETLQALRIHPVNAANKFVEKSTLHSVT